jgi:hypothetical protein
MGPLRHHAALTLCALPALLTASPAAAQTDMDVAWAQVRTCAQLDRFVGRFGSANRYADRIRERRSALCRTATVRPPRTPTPTPPRPQPQPPRLAQGDLLSGRQVADLYEKYWFCYDYAPDKHSCSVIETMVQRYPDRLVLVQYASSWLKESDRPAWTFGKSVPDRVRYIFHQQPSIRSNELCSTRSERRRDAGQIEVVPLLGTERTYLPDDRLQAARGAIASAAAAEPYDLFCSRYRLATAPGAADAALIESSYRDRAASPARTSNIRLLPLSGKTPFIEMQE